MSTELGPTFRFVEWKSVIANTPREDYWFPDVYPKDGGKVRDLHQEIVAKWVYVFQCSGSQTIWYGEYFCDDRQIYPVDLTVSRGLEREHRKRAASGAQGVTLPHTVNGVSVYYCSYVSRIQLPLAMVKELTAHPGILFQTKVSYIAPPEDYSNPLKLWYDGVNQWYFRALDPITVALNLGAAYRAACDDMMGYSSFYEEQPESQRRQVSDRLNKKTMGQQISAILDADPTDPLGLRGIGVFKPGGEAEMRAYVDDVTKQQEAKAKEADRRAAQLAHWLRGKLWDFARRAHASDPEADMPAFLNAYAQSMTRLVESTPGKEYLINQVMDEDSLVNVYALRKSMAPQSIFHTGRLASLAIISMFGEASSVVIKLHPPEVAANLLADALYYISTLHILTSSTVGISRQALMDHRTFLEVRTTFAVLRLNDLSAEQWQKWTPAAKASKEQLTGAFKRIIPIITFAMAVRSLRQTADWDALTAVKMVKVILTIPGVVEALGLIALKELYKKPMAVVAATAAVTDMIAGGLNAANAAARNDYSAAIGYGLFIGMGSALSAVGAIMVGFSIAADATVVGLAPGAVVGVVGSVVSGVGWAIVILTTDTDMQTFVSHCAWGQHYGQGSASLPWSEGPLAEWKGRYDRQLLAMFNIVSSFVVQGVGLRKIRVEWGELNDRSLFYIEFESRTGVAACPWHIPTLCVSVAHQEMRYVSGDPADLTRISFVDRDGRHGFEIEASWPPYGAPSGWGRVVDSRCKIYLDPDGDGSYVFPRSGEKVQYVIQDNPFTWNTERVNSKDF